MTDPIDVVRTANPVPDPRADPRSPLELSSRRQLLDVILATDPHTRERTTQVAAGRPSWRHGARALVLVIVMALATGVATAAVLLDGATHSAPLAGAFPGSKHSLSSTNYRIGFTPDITGGVVGWCDQIEFTTRLMHPTKRDHFARVYGTDGGGAAGCGSGPTAAEPFIDADVVSGSGGRDGRHFSYQVAYYLTAPQVAAVRVSPTLTILTRPEPGLPDGYRVAVGFPAQEGGGTPRAIGAFGPVALAADGGELARRHPPTGGPWVPDPTVSWRRSPRVLPRVLGSLALLYAEAHRRMPVPRKPPAGPCAIDSSHLSGAQQQFGNVVVQLRPVPQVIGRAYISCIDTQITYRWWALDAALLLDAHHPGALPAPLPGANPVPGHPGVVNERSGIFGDITGRRVGDAWLVVESGSRLTLRAGGLAQRLEVLDALRTCVRIAGHC
ncbi:MAG TPA: hypothetical protein VNV42_16460 [Solirubrobacteraceae bacterium]|jgi:hypothetical protein|nr:hypothetical protein [Solirubrobacteraceae bacterium]